MMRLVLVGLLILMGSSADAQNWQTVRVMDTNFYNGGRLFTNIRQYDSDLVRTVWIDSSNTLAGDSVFYFFRGIRGPISFGFPNPCLDTLAPSWLGLQMVRKSNGTEFYFNSTGDTITFNTNAPLGNSWVLAKDTNGTAYVGTVTAISLGTVDGKLDSIKTISIQAMNGAAPVADPYNSHHFKLSKEHGWISTLDLFRFPNKLPRTALVGLIIDSLQHERLPKSFGEWSTDHVDLAWRYTSGNETITTVSSGVAPSEGANKIVKHDSVISFTQLAGSKGLATMLTKSFTISWQNTSSPQSPVWVSTVSGTTNIHTDTVFDHGVGNLVKGYLLYESKLQSMSAQLRDPFFTRNYVDTLCNGKWLLNTRTQYGNFFSYNSLTSCWNYRAALSDVTTHDDAYVQDFGSILSYTGNFGGGSTGASFKREVTYAKLPGCGWGQKVNVLRLGVGGEHSKYPAFSIAPNPANERILISSGMAQQDVVLSLRNITGQRIWEGTFAGQSYSIPTSAVPSGIYFLEVAGKKFRQVLKVTVQH